jgi:predicted ferric reductase
MNSSNPELAQKKSLELRQMLKSLLLLFVAGGLFIALLLLLWFLNSPLGASSAQTLTSLFAADSTQAWWYITRAAGLTGYFLIWLSTAWGLALATKMLHPVVENTYTYDFHEFLSLLGLGFILLHILVLFFDQYLPFSLLQVLVPFLDSYRPFWVGLGVIGFYLFLLVTVTFYIRQRIGSDLFRAIHVFSLLGYLGVTLHGLFAGTDSGLPVTRILYGGSFLVILFLTVYWFAMKRLNATKPIPAPVKSAPARKNASTYQGSYQKIKPGSTNPQSNPRRRH